MVFKKLVTATATKEIPTKPHRNTTIMITVFSFSVNLFVKYFVDVVVDIGNLVVVEVGIEVEVVAVAVAVAVAVVEVALAVVAGVVVVVEYISVVVLISGVAVVVESSLGMEQFLLG